MPLPKPAVSPGWRTRNRISSPASGRTATAQNYLINADELMTGDTTNRWPLRDGDVITVAERMF